MFDGRLNFLKKYAFLEGIAIGFLICHALYSQVWVARIKDGNDAQAKVADAELRSEKQRTGQLQKEIDRHDDYEKKFQSEALARAIAERKLTELQIDTDALDRRYKGLIEMKWEEKFNAEKLARVVGEEERALLTKRLAAANDHIPKADPYLVKQLELLTDQNRILAKERDELRKLYTGSNQVSLTAKSIPTNGLSAESRGRIILASLSGVNILHAASAIINAVKNAGGPIDGESFSKMLSAVDLLHRADVVVACAPYVARPLTESQIKAISDQLWELDAERPMAALLNAQLKK